MKIITKRASFLCLLLLTTLLFCGLYKGVSLNRQYEYVVYAVADKWLTDNRFGSF